MVLVWGKKYQTLGGPGRGCAGVGGETLLWKRCGAGPLKGSSGHERDFFPLG